MIMQVLSFDKSGRVWTPTLIIDIIRLIAKETLLQYLVSENISVNRLEKEHNEKVYATDQQ